VCWEAWHPFYDNIKLARTVAMVAPRGEWVALHKIFDFEVERVEVLR
jgi:hypothetical protein